MEMSSPQELTLVEEVSHGPVGPLGKSWKLCKANQKTDY
jgi:hypothetical protein